jgi:hypothetical protein
MHILKKSRCPLDTLLEGKRLGMVSCDQIMPRRLSGYTEMIPSFNDLLLLTVSSFLHERSFYMST